MSEEEVQKKVNLYYLIYGILAIGLAVTAYAKAIFEQLNVQVELRGPATLLVLISLIFIIPAVTDAIFILFGTGRIRRNKLSDAALIIGMLTTFYVIIIYIFNKIQLLDSNFYTGTTIIVLITSIIALLFIDFILAIISLFLRKKENKEEVPVQQPQYYPRRPPVLIPIKRSIPYQRPYLQR